MFKAGAFSEARDIVTAEVVSAVNAIDEGQVAKYMEMILGAERVFFTGVGRSLLAMQCVAKRYAHLGIDAVVVGEITEPAITERDVLVAGSGSGETFFPLGVAKKAHSFGAKVIRIGSNPVSSMSDIEDLFVRIPVESRAKLPDELHSEQPMTSLFEQALLIFGDITSLMIVREKGMDLDTLWRFHANLE